MYISNLNEVDNMCVVKSYFHHMFRYAKSLARNIEKVCGPLFGYLIIVTTLYIVVWKSFT